MIKETIIGEIKKNHYEVLRFTLVEDDTIGKRYLDVRMYFRRAERPGGSRNGKRHLIPTQKGICLGAKGIVAAKEFMRQASNMLTAGDAEDSVTAAVVGGDEAGDGG